MSKKIGLLKLAASCCVLRISGLCRVKAFSPNYFGGGQKSVVFSTTLMALKDTEIPSLITHEASDNPKDDANIKKKPLEGRKKNDKKRQKNRQRKSKLGQRKRVPILPITDLKLGSTIDGHVAAFTDFGVFIKIPYDLKGKKQKNGGYALLHKSQIMDETVDDVKKLFRIGAEVKNLRVININFARGEVGLSLRKQREKRREISEFKVGAEYEGKINRVVSYGAFVDVGAKQNALLHISRLSSKRIENIRNLVNEGDRVIVRIISKDEKKQTMAASMLSPEADKYLDTRSKQLDRMRTRAQNSANEDDQSGLKTEVEYFEDAIRELEASLE